VHFRRPVPPNSLDWSMMREDNAGEKIKGGFTSFQASATTLRLRYHDHEGNVLYVAPPIQPRRVTTAGSLSDDVSVE